MWTAEFLGILAFSLHMLAYGMYAQQVLTEKVKPNAATWLMWLFGGIVEWQTYDHMTGSHWSSSLLPLACVFGLTGIFFAMVFAQLRENRRGRGRFTYHKPDWKDWALVGFDLGALVLWLGWDMAEEANTFAVVTTIMTFIPLWRTTWREPETENPYMWIIWSFAYVCMLAALTERGGDNLLWQGVYPFYYCILHLTVAVLVIWPRGLRQRHYHVPAE